MITATTAEEVGGRGAASRRWYPMRRLPAGPAPNSSIPPTPPQRMARSAVSRALDIAGVHRGLRRGSGPRRCFPAWHRAPARGGRHEEGQEEIARDPLFGGQDTRKRFAVSMFDAGATSRGPLFFIWSA